MSSSLQYTGNLDQAYILKASLRILIFSLNKSAEKARKSQRQNYATKVRKSIKSLTNASFDS